MYAVSRADGVSLQALRDEITAVPLERIPDNSGAARGENAQEGWIHGLEMTRLYGPGYDDVLNSFPMITHAIAIFANQREQEIHQVMVNKLNPHSFLGKHRDGPPQMDRWHLPVITNPLCEWYDEIDGWCHMEEGKWHGPVNYCGILHAMHNDGDNARYHLVLDLVPLATETSSEISK